MHLFLLSLAILTFILVTAAGIQITLGGRRLSRLENIQPIADQLAPKLSIIVPACNEERAIQHALSSLLLQDYPDFEIIAVNDRSTDSTGAILDRLAASHPRLRVDHIIELPPGWLGKNHALQHGAQRASGEYLLFTDADVVMQPSVARRAVGYMLRHHVDHLAIPPRAVVGGFLANAFIGAFAIGFSLYTQPWKVRDPKSPKHVGIGAFNMLRTAAYWGAGGHTPIAMRPDDDIKLGKLMKLRGYRQDLVFGTQMLEVEWYRSFSEMRNGLMKNLFAGAGYSISKVLAGCVAQAVFLIWPFAAIIVTTGAIRWWNLLAVAALCTLFALNARLIGIRNWTWCFALPLAGALTIYLLLRAMLLTLIHGGIEWRGTKYPLAALKANQI